VYEIKIAGMVTLFYPNDDDFNNFETYLDDIEKLYIIDNTKEVGNDIKIPHSNKIKYIYNGKNIGVASSLNRGAREAIEENYSWLLTMDQDTKFSKNAIKKIKEYISNNDTTNIGIISPWHNTKLKINKPKEEIDYPVDVMTSGNFINLDIYQKVGGYKDWLFIDAVDIEYCLNLWSNGYKVVRLNSIEIDHNLGDIFTRHFLGRDITCINHNHLRRYYIMRNNLYVRDMYKNFFREYCMNLANQRSNLLKILLFEKDKFRKLRESLRGYIDYKRNIKGEYHYDIKK
jgi:rhamnosyltransferase